MVRVGPQRHRKRRWGPERDADQSFPSSAGVKNKLDLYLHSPQAFVACTGIVLSFTFFCNTRLNSQTVIEQGTQFPKNVETTSEF
jgi:hypothetical protein